MGQGEIQCSAQFQAVEMRCQDGRRERRKSDTVEDIVPRRAERLSGSPRLHHVQVFLRLRIGICPIAPFTATATAKACTSLCFIDEKLRDSVWRATAAAIEKVLLRPKFIASFSFSFSFPFSASTILSRRCYERKARGTFRASDRSVDVDVDGCAGWHAGR